MPGHSSRGPQSSRHQSRYVSRPEAMGYRQAPTFSKDSSLSQDLKRELCTVEPQRSHKPRPRLANGCEPETLGCVPGSAESPVPPSPCVPCSSLGGWGSCAAFICCVLTCGLYGGAKPCQAANESSTDPEPGARPSPSVPKGNLECRTGGLAPNGLAISNPSCGVPLEPAPKATKLPMFDSFRYGDVCINGQKVRYQDVASGPSRRTRPTSSGYHRGETQRPVSNTSVYSREDLDLDDLNDSGVDIDALIRRKLLELYKLHQIEQLAQCTSDSSFSRRTNEISDLINSIAQDYNLQEQEAECRLVQGVIRISTRKSKRGGHAHRDRDPAHQEAGQRSSGRRDRTFPDSGNDTMIDTFNTNDTEPEVKVSEQTPSDVLARRMRLHSGQAVSSSYPMDFSRGQPEMETDSSGVPLLRHHRT